MITIVINMVRVPVISDAEWEVMEVLWLRGKASAEQVVEALGDKRDWNPRTIKTLLNRLLKKKALDFEVIGKKYIYWPRVGREVCVRAESQSFLAKVFAGNRGEMLCRFVDETKLSESEIRQLRRILDQKAKGK